jgi:hypothetical protein
MTEQTFADPINCTIDFDSSTLRGKTAIVTGGVDGLGQAYVRALDAVGYVSMSPRLQISEKVLRTAA